MSNFYCHPGRAGGSPVFSIDRIVGLADHFFSVVVRLRNQYGAEDFLAVRVSVRPVVLAKTVGCTK